MSGHTPGPWRDIGTLPSEEDPDNGERFIGQVLVGRDCGYGVACALPCGTPDTTPERTVSNARLIAAAPELLEELQNIANAKRFDREAFENDTAFVEWARSRARYAIAKATGEAS